MRRIGSYNIKLKRETPKFNWRRRPSEMRGYSRALYANSENGDYLRVDYNISDRRVRLYLEDSEEGGNPYYSVISDGKITAERNATTGRSCNLSGRFGKRAEIFSTIPNKEVVKLINKNYNVGVKLKNIKQREVERKQELEETRKRYFKGDSDIQRTVGGGRGVQVGISEIKLFDFIDIFIGIAVCYLVYIYWHSFISVGIVSAIFGVLTGILDVFFRVRELFIIKNIFFILAGLAFYIYGYYFF